MAIHFNCTQCGACCHNLRLPLSLAESADWIRRGGDVQLFVEAIPWPVEPPDTDVQAAHKRRRSFAAASGTLPIRVIVNTVASFDDACPHLLPDARCGAYLERPRVCRIYPAEINPFVELTPASKACPPEAWGADMPVFSAAGTIVDEQTLELIQASRAADAQDAPLKQQLCESLGITQTALANEGFLIYSFARDTILSALERLTSSAEVPSQTGAWEFVSNRRATVDTLVSIEAGCVVPAEPAAANVNYMAFFAADL
jgi:Fe-S-cluster containining protein